MHPIAERRRTRGWSQSHLADATELNLRTIKRAEAGEGIKPESLLAICAALECCPADLVQRPDTIRPKSTVPPWSLQDHLGAITAGTAAFLASYTAGFLFIALYSTGHRSIEHSRHLVWAIWGTVGVVEGACLYGAIALPFATARWCRTTPLWVKLVCISGIGMYPGSTMGCWLDQKDIDAAALNILALPGGILYMTAAAVIGTTPIDIAIAMIRRRATSACACCSIAAIVGIWCDIPSLILVGAAVPSIPLMSGRRPTSPEAALFALMWTPMGVYLGQAALPQAHTHLLAPAIQALSGCAAIIGIVLASRQWSLPSERTDGGQAVTRRGTSTATSAGVTPHGRTTAIPQASDTSGDSTVTVE